MTELLFFKHDHSVDLTLSAPQLMALPNAFDLVVVEPDGWKWSNEELTNPWFRIISWPLLTWPLSTTVMTFLESTENDKVHFFRYRGKFLDLNHVSIPVALKTWWLDDTRAVPIFNVTFNPGTVIATIGVTRPLVTK